MKRKHAVEAIKAILAAIDDHELPEAKIEKDGETVIAWLGGCGRHLGSATRNGKLEPMVYRDSAAREAIELEAVCRLDIAYQREAAK